MYRPRHRGAFDAGPLVNARETLRAFASSRPSLFELVANRRGRFEGAHAILPSTVVVGEEVELLVQAWDQCERLLDGFDGEFRRSSTDPDAGLLARVAFPPASGGVTTEAGLTFRTPGIHYLTLERVGTGERFHANPVVVHDSEPDRRLYWSDIHLHSQLSDGAGSMARDLRYGRDVIADRYLSGESHSREYTSGDDSAEEGGRLTVPQDSQVDADTQ